MSASIPSLPHFRIFVSSPMDVAEERQMTRDFIEQDLPKRPALRGKATFEVFDWSDPHRDPPMLAGLTPQEAINRGLARPSECDLTIVILWGRMGQPLSEETLKPDGSRYMSGTEWEFEDAFGADPESVLIYRRTSPPVAQSGEPEEFREIAEQGERLRDFLAQFRNADGSYAGCVNPYETPADFKEKLARQLETIALEWLPKEEPLPLNQPTPPEPESAWEFPDLNNSRGWRAEAVELERVPSYHQDMIERLQSEHWGQRYRRMLATILAVAERIWGPRGSSQAFVTCMFFSLVYAYALFWMSLSSGVDNPFGEVAGLRKFTGLSLTGRWLLFGFTVLYPVAMWPLGRWLGYVEKRYQTSQRRKRKSPQARRRWSRLYRAVSSVMLVVLVVGLTSLSQRYDLPDIPDMMVVSIGLGMLFAACPVFGVAWGGRARMPWSAFFLSMVAVAVTFALAGAFAVMSVRAGVKRVNLYAAIIGGFRYWHFWDCPSKRTIPCLISPFPCW